MFWVKVLSPGGLDVGSCGRMLWYFWVLATRAPSMGECCNRVDGRGIGHHQLVRSSRGEQVEIQVALSNQLVFRYFSLLLWISSEISQQIQCQGKLHTPHQLLKDLYESDNVEGEGKMSQTTVDSHLSHSFSEDDRQSSCASNCLPNF